MNNVAPMIEPNTAMMRRHVAHLFEGWLDGCHEGLIELAWTDGRDGKLRHARTFGTDQLDELVELAVAENRKPGQNPNNCRRKAIMPNWLSVRPWFGLPARICR